MDNTQDETNPKSEKTNHKEEKIKPREPVFPCKLCSLVFEIFKIVIFIYFFIFIGSVLQSKFPSPGELLNETISTVSKIGENITNQIFYGKK